MAQNLEARLESLENAHRALAAQNTALIEIFKITAPLMNLNRDALSQRLMVAYDTIGELMQEDGFDEEYQAEVRHWYDVLSQRVLSGRCDAHPNRGE